MNAGMKDQYIVVAKPSGDESHWVLAGFIAAAQPTMSAYGMRVLARVLVSD